MKIFMNSKGEYLKWVHCETGVISGGSCHYFEWVSEINEASVADEIPQSTQDARLSIHHPHDQVVVELEATLKTTRMVTVIRAAERTTAQPVENFSIL